MTAIDRLLGLLFLTCVLPVLVAVGVCLHVLSPDKPVLLAEDIQQDDGIRFHCYQFRTTGPGGPLFHWIGGHLQATCFDKWPALVAVVQGRIGFRQFLRLIRVI